MKNHTVLGRELKFKPSLIPKFMHFLPGHSVFQSANVRKKRWSCSGQQWYPSTLQVSAHYTSNHSPLQQREPQLPGVSAHRQAPNCSPLLLRKPGQQRLLRETDRFFRGTKSPSISSKHGKPTKAGSPLTCKYGSSQIRVIGEITTHAHSCLHFRGFNLLDILCFWSFWNL